MKTYAVRVAKRTKDALTSTDPNDFILDTTKNTPKILAKGLLINQSVTSDPTTIQVAHGLSFTPTVNGHAKFPDGKVASASSIDYTRKPLVSLGYGQFDVEVDGTYLYFILGKNGSNYNVSISYKIFESPL